MTTETAPVTGPAGTRIIKTLEEFLALPDDGVERWVVLGQLRESRGEHPVPVRNRFHSLVMGFVALELGTWNRHQPEPRGQVLVGDAGVRLRLDPLTVVGIDLAYISAEVAARQSDATTLIDGIPTLAVEILSPNDVIEDIREKTDDYLAVGVPLVWILDPHWRTVTVHQPRARPRLFNVDDELTAEPHLPGFRVPMAGLFG